MLNYTLPGVPVRRRGARIAGTVVVVLGVTVAVAMNIVSNSPATDRIRVHLRTEQIGAGITNGTTVQLDGVDVGKVETIVSLASGREQAVTLALDRAQTAGLTDRLDIAYAPSNLFGISALILKQADTGTPLRDGTTVDLTGTAAGRVADLTMGQLLRALTETSVKVLTPQLTDLITTFGSDVRQFTPFLESLVTLTRTIAETQRYAPSYLVDQYGSLIGGLTEFSSSTITLLKTVLDIEVLQNDRPRYDATMSMLSDQMFPGIARTSYALGDSLQGATDMLTPLLQALADTVPTPAASRAQLTELIDRLDRMFTSTPGGPVLNVRVILQNVPGLSVPLLGQAGPR